ncbi:competence/damage-inducible protein A [Planctomycetota bacterium]
MINASIVTIGNEILSGRTVDTNAAFIGTELLNIGIPVVSSFTVGDDLEAIFRALNLAAAEAELIIATGGLGPTDDDLTRQAFAKFLGVNLELHEDILEKIRNLFARRNMQMPENNKIQAFIPAGAEALANSGTAPGILAESKGKLFIALPGVPIEAQRMLESVLDRLKNRAGTQAIETRRIKCFGAGESTITEKLGDMMARNRNPLINCTAHDGIITLHIIASAQDKNQAVEIADEDEKTIHEKLGELIYGTENQTLADVVAEKLSRLEKKIATAESCTGGLLSKMLTDIPGASEYFTHGWITYSNESKTEELLVLPELIGQYGAVSEQVAEAMARGARKKSRTDFAISITGIAGPEGGTQEKPVGLVYICIDSESCCQIKRCLFTSKRRFIRLRAAQTALNMLRLKLKD